VVDGVSLQLLHLSPFDDTDVIRLRNATHRFYNLNSKHERRYQTADCARQWLQRFSSTPPAHRTYIDGTHRNWFPWIPL